MTKDPRHGHIAAPLHDPDPTTQANEFAPADAAVPLPDTLVTAATVASASSTTTRYLPNAVGAYDQFGHYDTGLDAHSTSVSEGPGGAVPAEIAYATFNAVAIEQQVVAAELAGDIVSVELTYQVADGYGVDHHAIMTVGFFNAAGDQSTVEADTTNNTGPGVGDYAYVYQELLNSAGHDKGITQTVVSSQEFHFNGQTGEHLTYDSDVTQALAAAAADHRDLVLSLEEPEEGGQGGGIFNNDSGGVADYLIAPQIVITVTSPGTPPSISGTTADQRLTVGMADTPFAGVMLADPMNPGGAGDQIYITVLDPNGNGTDQDGYLTDQAGVPLVEFAPGSYFLGSATSLSQLQQTLDGLHFQSLDTPQDSVVHFEIDFQSTAGTVTSNAATSIDLVNCFAAGVRLLTPHGETPVERLAAGDAIVTAAGVTRPIRWVGRTTIDALTADPMRVFPVRIHAGALGAELPSRDLLVSPCHALLLGGVLVEAGALVNGTSITRERQLPQGFVYYHVELADHDLLVAEGVAAESFVDNAGRLGFDNWQDHPSLHLGPAPVTEMDLPRARSARQVPAAVRQQLLELAGPAHDLAA